jgi:hypothetical protein
LQCLGPWAAWLQPRLLLLLLLLLLLPLLLLHQQVPS